MIMTMMKLRDIIHNFFEDSDVQINTRVRMNISGWCKLRG